MHRDQFDLLLEETELALLGGQRVGLLGLTPLTLRLVRSLSITGLASSLHGIFVLKSHEAMRLQVPIRPLEEIDHHELDALVVCSDAEKEDLIEDALPYITGAPHLIIVGYKHYRFRDATFDEIAQSTLVPSIANGYAHCQVHLYQCLANAARLGLQGTVAEFGTYKGGTAVFLARSARRLGQSWPVVSFDTVDGFPPRRSPLDMYDNPETEFRDRVAVEAYVRGADVELVIGDICDTVTQLADRTFVLSFFDTDNYSSAAAGLEVVRDRTLVGGAIVFDHWVGREKFRYTLGERFAAKVLLDDKRYFNPHGTGIFLRQI